MFVSIGVSGGGCKRVVVCEAAAVPSRGQLPMCRSHTTTASASLVHVERRGGGGGGGGGGGRRRRGKEEEEGGRRGGMKEEKKKKCKYATLKYGRKKRN